MSRTGSLEEKFEHLRRKEALIKNLHQDGDFGQATEEALDLYGQSIFSWLMARLDSRASAEDVYQEFCKALVEGLPRFEWRSSLKTWSYTIARNLMYLYRKKQFKRKDKIGQDAEDADEYAEADPRVSTYRLPGAQEAFWTLCREVLDDDQLDILTLRIAAEMRWDVIASVVAGEDADRAEIAKASASLRKKFERIKESLRKAAEDRDLVRGQADTVDFVRRLSDFSEQK